MVAGGVIGSIDGGVVGGLLGGIAGGCAGICGGGLINTGVALCVFLLDGVRKGVTWSLSRGLILWKYSMLRCNHCMSHSQPFHSRYEDGRRYCEHCSQEIHTP